MTCSIFAWNFAWVILMISSMKYITRKLFIDGDCFFRQFQPLLRSALFYYLNFYLKYFPPGLKSSIPKAYKLFHFIKSISKICSVWYLLKIKWPKSDLHIWAGSFWTHVPPPVESVCDGSYWRPGWFMWCQHKPWKLLQHFKQSITFLPVWS